MAITTAPNAPDYSNIWKIWGGLSNLCTQTSIYIYGSRAADQAISGSTGGTVSGSSAGLVGAFEADAKRVDRLSENGDLGRGLREGTFEAARWLDIAQTTWDDLASLQEAAGHAAFRFTDLWGEVAVPTLNTLKQKAEDAAEAAESNFYPILILVVVGLIALAVVRVA